MSSNFHPAPRAPLALSRLSGRLLLLLRLART
jgi:hypothetical protein